MTDPIADFLIRIKNAYLAKQDKVVVPTSKLKLAIANVFLKEGFLAQVKTLSEGGKKWLDLTLLYKNSQPAIRQIHQVSKPGLRKYVPVDELGRKRGLGIIILSTPAGVITDQQARKNHLGGEVLCQVW